MKGKRWIALAALCLTACAHDNTGPAVPGKYVAMGSSFAAGAGIGATKPGTPGRCQRATNNYATLLAGRLGLALDDQSCGGATTAHLLGPWEELSAQVDAITADTQLVTITVGGNDLNYVGHLVMAGCKPELGLTYKGVTYPCRTLDMPTEADYADLEKQLIGIGTEVRRRAPQAKLVFVQYVTLIPKTLCSYTAMSAQRAAELRELGKRLALQTRRAAAATGALVLETGSLSENHTACDDDPWSKASRDPEDSSPGAIWHPNARGHAAIAAALVNLLSANDGGF